MAALPLDDSYKPAIGGYDATGHQVAAVDIVSVATDGTTLIKHGPMSVLDTNSAAWLAAMQALNPSRTFITASSTATAGSAATATLAATSGKTTFISGFTVIAGTVAAAVQGIVTITGLITGTASYYLVETVAAGGVINIQYSSGIPASAVNTTIVINVPAIASGGVISVTATGYQQ